jgi:hypothetical protein
MVHPCLANPPVREDMKIAQGRSPHGQVFVRGVESETQGQHHPTNPPSRRAGVRLPSPRNTAD